MILDFVLEGLGLLEILTILGILNLSPTLSIFACLEMLTGRIGEIYLSI